MKVGCGLEVRIIKGRRYLYFWRCGEAADRRGRSWKYLGPAGDDETKRKAPVELGNSYDAARGEMERRLRIVRTRPMRLR